MSATIDDGGPAFPFHYDAGGPYPNYVSGNGMALRDYFAGQALAGITANANFFGSMFQQEPTQAALFSYEAADAMLKARKP